jgi:competence protein ComEA
MNVSKSKKGGAEQGIIGAAGAVGEEGLLARARRAVSDSAWGSLVGKGLLTVVAFALLALVGSGRLRWPTPQAPVAVGIAEAAAAPLPSALPAARARVEPAPSASASASAEAKVAEPPPADAGAAPTSGVSADGKVILNLASEEELRRLPSIGATRAKAILALRTRLGRFSRVEDLLKVKGIGRRSLARLKPLVLIDPG